MYIGKSPLDRIVGRGKEKSAKYYLGKLPLSRVIGQNPETRQINHKKKKN